MSCVFCTRKEKMMGVYIEGGALIVPVAELIENRVVEHEERISIDVCPWCGDKLSKIERFDGDDTQAPVCNCCGREAPRGETVELGREAVTMFKTDTCRCQPPRKTPLPELPKYKSGGDMVETIKACISKKTLIGVEKPTVFEAVQAALKIDNEDDALPWRS